MRIPFSSLLLLGFAAVSCDRMMTPPHAQQLKDADGKAAAGDYMRAVSLYESALEDRPSDAEVHYKLGLLYDDKLNDALSAVYHFRRSLTVAPSGAHTSDIKNFIKRDEVTLLTTLSGDALLSRTEATRLRNENLALRHENDELKGHVSSEKSSEAGRSAKGGKSYVVQPGDTLASISRKFFKNSSHWQQILRANRGVISDPKKLTVGQTIVIPGR